MSSLHAPVVKYNSSKTKSVDVGSLVFDGSNGTMGSALTVLNVIMADVSTAGSAFVASPVAGTIIRIQSIIDGAIATANAGITTEINGVAVTGGAITITQSGSAAGDVDVATPTAANVVAVGDAIELITDGASTNTVRVNFSVTIQRSA